MKEDCGCKCVTIEEAAALLNADKEFVTFYGKKVTPHTVKKWCADGKLQTAHHIHKSWAINEAELKNWRELQFVSNLPKRRRSRTAWGNFFERYARILFDAFPYTSDGETETPRAYALRIMRHRHPHIPSDKEVAGLIQELSESPRGFAPPASRARKDITKTLQALAEAALAKRKEE